MSFANFIPAVWNAAIRKEVEKKLVFAQDCNREYEGDVKQAGDQIRILNVGKPTIKKLDWSNPEDRKKFAGDNGGIGTAEDIEGASITMQINQIAHFYYKVNDIDQAQAKKGVTEALQSETSEGLSDQMDRDISGLALEAKGDTLFNTASININVNNVLKTLDKMLAKFLTRGVSEKARIVMEVPYDFYMVVKEAYSNVDTDNSELLAKGIVGQYNRILFKTTNNVAKSGNDYMIMLRTNRAVAFANPLVFTEAERTKGGFADAIKGYVLYDQKVVRPNELLVLKCTVDMDADKVVKTKTVTE